MIKVMKNVLENKQMLIILLYIIYLISNCIALSCNNNCCYIIKIIHNMLKCSVRVLFTQPRVRYDSS